MPSTHDSQDTRADLVRLPEALRITGHSRTTFLDLVRSGEMPEPLRIGKRAVAWRRGELLDWIDGRPRAQRVSRPATTAPRVAA